MTFAEATLMYREQLHTAAAMLEAATVLNNYDQKCHKIEDNTNPAVVLLLGEQARIDNWLTWFRKSEVMTPPPIISVTLPGGITYMNSKCTGPVGDGSDEE